LLPHHIGAPGSWQILDQANDRQRERARAILQVDLRHDPAFTFRIPNSAFRISFIPKSAITLSSS